MAYLTCPECGITLFDRNPLAPRHHCPRCASRRGVHVELERFARADGAAAASVLGAHPAAGAPGGGPNGREADTA